MAEKKFKIKSEDIKRIIGPMGACIASDKITVDGLLIGYMYRDNPNFEKDSGWRFFSGTEDQEYVDNENNMMIYDVNTIANYDPSIIPYLELPIGTQLEKVENSNKFEIVEE